jgi:hypothetical protein
MTVAAGRHPMDLRGVRACVLLCCLLLPARPGLAQETAGPPAALDGERYAQVARGDVRVRFAPGDSLAAERVLDFLLAQTPLPGLPDTLPAHVTAVLAHSARAFDEVTGGNVPEWRAGVAIPSLGLLVVPLEGRPLLDAEGRRVLRHEWAHLGLHQYLEGLRVPRWFDEGYAQYASGGWDALEAWRLRVLIALGRAPPLDSLALVWPRDRASAEAAYLLAASAVDYLLRSGRGHALGVFLERWRDEGSFEVALRGTFGVTSGQLEEDWRRWVKSRYGWFFVLTRSAVFWMLLALVLLLMARNRQARNRERLARLRAGEAPDAPAWWDEPEATDETETPPRGVEGPP